MIPDLEELAHLNDSQFLTKDLDHLKYPMQQDKNLQRWDRDFRGVKGRRIGEEDGE